VNACAISPDGSWLASASFDGTLKIWDVASGQERHTLSGHEDTVNICAISPDGSWLLSASDDGTLRIWDGVSGQIRHTLTEHTDAVNACAISPDGSWLVSASSDGTLKSWNISAMEKVREVLTFHANGELNDCEFCLDWKHIIAVGASGIYFFRVVDE
jgi:WD40 repeat protein